MQSKTNWLAVLVAVIAGMFIGFLWYGVFFQAQWAEAVGMTGPGLTEPGQEVLKHGTPITLDPVTPMIINAVSLAIYALILNWLVVQTNRYSFAGGAGLGALVGTVPLLTSYVGNRFSADPTILSMIDGSYYLVLFAVIGGIIGAWRRK